MGFPTMGMRMTPDMRRYLESIGCPMERPRRREHRDRKANRHRHAGADPGPREPPGTVICEGIVLGRPVPWKAPTVNREGHVVPTDAHRRYSNWRNAVTGSALALMGGRPAYGHPVALDVTFYLVRRDARPVGDLTNLVKSFEDGLQGVVFVNDAQVEAGESRRVMLDEGRDHVEFRVVAT